MPDSSGVTYAQLERLLLSLGFEDRSVEGSHRAFFHSALDTWIAFSDHRADEFAREVDLASVRRHLVENGILKETVFARFSRDPETTISAM